MSNLPSELVEEVLSRVTVTSLRSIRSTCKSWYALSKDLRFAKKHVSRQTEEKKYMMVLFNSRVYLMSVNHKQESCMKREGSLISLDNSNQTDISQVFHSDGLVLCISKDYTKLVVWNPYSGQTRWIPPTYNYHRLDHYSYALGYEKRSKSCNKILRFIHLGFPSLVEYEIYYFNSDSWSVMYVTPGRNRAYSDHGVSLKGNTCWFVQEKPDSYLLCFDFTRERFGPRLPLPSSIEWVPKDTLMLSSVREEQLAVLFQRRSRMEIWVTTKIKPNDVSWNSKVFLADTSFCLDFRSASFFIDEEKKVAVVFDKVNRLSNAAYIFGVDGSFKRVSIGESAGYARVCSYVPSLAQLN